MDKESGLNGHLIYSETLDYADSLAAAAHAVVSTWDDGDQL